MSTKEKRKPRRSCNFKKKLKCPYCDVEARVVIKNYYERLECCGISLHDQHVRAVNNLDYQYVKSKRNTSDTGETSFKSGWVEED